MIQLIHSTEANGCASKIYLLETSATEITGLAAETISGFQSSDKKFDYFKSSEGFTFLVKTHIMTLKICKGIELFFLADCKVPLLKP